MHTLPSDGCDFKVEPVADCYSAAAALCTGMGRGKCGAAEHAASTGVGISERAAAAASNRKLAQLPQHHYQLFTSSEENVHEGGT